MSTAHRLLAVDYMTMRGLGPIEMLEVANELGCASISLMVRRLRQFAPVDLIGDRALRNETILRKNDLGIEIDAIECFAIEPTTDVSDLAPTLEIGALLGSRFVMSLPEDDDLERLASTYAALAELAGGFGLEVLIEVHRLKSLTSAKHGVAFIQQYELTNVRLLLDSLHYFRSGGTLDELGAIVPYIGRVQLCDGPLTADDETYMYESRVRRDAPGEGSLPIEEFIRALSVDTRLGIEFPHPDFPPRERARHAVQATRVLVQRIARGISA